MASGVSASGEMERSVLLAVSEPDTAALLEQAFAFHGFAALRAANGAEALAALQRGEGAGPDLLVVDLAQPDVDGLLLCADLRQRTAAPIIVCGTQDERREALLAFRLGADDFVAKPFDVDDVVARGEAAVRRAAGRATATARGSAGEGNVVELRVGGTPVGGRSASGDAAAMVRVGDLALDQAHHRVLVGDRDVKLSRSEFLLLSALMARPDELLSRLDLALAVWGEQLARVGRPIDQHMYRLRAKLQTAAREAGVPAPTIVSVPGFGYRLVERAEELPAAS